MTDSRIPQPAVRRSYDAVAEDYATRLAGELAGKPLDRALLAALVEETAPGGRIADLGSGPGHVAAWLAAHGAAATTAVDLSPGMVEAGRRRFPEVDFRVGDLLELPAKDGEFAAAVAFYTLIHLRPEDLPRAFAEAHRVLRSEGLLLLAFHIGDEVRHMDEWWGHDVDLDFRFLDPARLTNLLEESGFTVRMHLERAPHPDEAQTRRAYLLARRTG
ncbi:class I SAM-dependent methyltransferase [Streptomyces finlayi]|nr:class I SAM-dependent methyltransferase [Streptomyces finlayi]